MGLDLNMATVVRGNKLQNHGQDNPLAVREMYLKIRKRPGTPGVVMKLHLARGGTHRNRCTAIREWVVKALHLAPSQAAQVQGDVRNA